jgi:AmmeMemoRadiSam system protein A
MVAVMRAARALGATDAAVLRYADSGDVSGDKSSVVGYMSAVLGTRGTEKRSGASDRNQTGMNLTTAESRRRILEIAHDAIVDRVRGSRRPTAFVETGLMDEPRGLFVTVRVAGELRGCIGHLEGNRPMPEIVARCAAAACSTDPRFQPLTEAELPGLEVEVSLLGDFEPASGPAEISIGRHGLLVESDSRRGLLLPQVATDWNWDAAEFLAQTCVKAGLPRDAWKTGARIWKFEAEVIGGHEAG